MLVERNSSEALYFPGFCTRLETESLWFSWNLNGVSRTAEERLLWTRLFPITVNKRGDSKHIFLHRRVRLEEDEERGERERERERGRFTRYADVILVRDPFSATRRREHFHLDAHLAEKISRGYITVTLCLLSFEETGTRCYLWNKRSRLNALLAIRTINAHPR